MLNFMKIHPVGAELLHADERTDRQTDRLTDIRKLIVAFRDFAKAPNNRMSLPTNLILVFSQHTTCNVNCALVQHVSTWRSHH